MANRPRLYLTTIVGIPTVTLVYKDMRAFNDFSNRNRSLNEIRAGNVMALRGVIEADSVEDVEDKLNKLNRKNTSSIEEELESQIMLIEEYRLMKPWTQLVSYYDFDDMKIKRTWEGIFD